MRTVSPTDALSRLWIVLGQPANVLSYTTLTDTEPALLLSFVVGTFTQGAIATVALAAAQVDMLRSGR